MSTIVGIMDRAGFDANTDNLVLVDPQREQLLWIPRDVWCVTLGDRINAAFRTGGHDLLTTAIREHGLEVNHSLLLSRTATESALAEVSVMVPVPARMTFAYPLTPTACIEDGSKEIVFEPPAVVLRGERVHQWIGARSGSDLHRIERQKIFVRRLLEQRFNFQRSLADPTLFKCSGQEALADLSSIRASWRFDTLGPTEPATIDGKQVLLRRLPHEQVDS
jgi:anionic cell wall polymer biosynthesis LytR-Cps2A-Psr (LCP) family protein